MKQRFLIPNHVYLRVQPTETLAVNGNESELILYSFDDETSRRIIGLLKEGKTKQEILQTLVAEFEAPEATIEKDLNSFLEELLKEKLIEVKG